MQNNLTFFTNLKNDYTHAVFIKDFETSFNAPICSIIKTINNLSQNCFLLESAESDKFNRFSFIGFCPKETISIIDKTLLKSKDGFITKLSDNIDVNDLAKYLTTLKLYKPDDAPPFCGGYIGYLSFDLVKLLEPTLDTALFDELNLPLLSLSLYDEIIVFDNEQNKYSYIKIISLHDNISRQLDEADNRFSYIKNLDFSEETEKSDSSTLFGLSNKENLTCSASKSHDEFIEIVKKAKNHIVDGDIFQIVPSIRFTLSHAPKPIDTYSCLRLSNPSPYLYYIKENNLAIVGSSPELLCKVERENENLKAYTCPIAGTAKRGKDEKEDKLLAENLLKNEKELAEHDMLVDLSRNDLGKVSKIGSIKLERYRSIERYSRVMHIVSEVSGILDESKIESTFSENDKNQRDLQLSLNALFSCLPAGTLSGAPKIKAISLIHELEKTARGIYGGAICYINFDGTINSCIAIRTALFKDDKAYVQAGCGVVFDSVEESEYQEIMNKASAVIEAMKSAHSNDL